MKVMSTMHLASNGRGPPFVKVVRKGCVGNAAPFEWNKDLQTQLKAAVAVDAYSTASNQGTTTTRILKQITFQNYMGKDGRECHRERLFKGIGKYERICVVKDAVDIEAAMGTEVYLISFMFHYVLIQ